jgi:DeoR/GlpR family transcriptional regulator of sugar metabolism
LIEKSSPELPILEREHQQSTEKEHIGKAAVRLISMVKQFFLAAGRLSSPSLVNCLIYKNLTVLTNSLPIINTLVGHPGINLVILGGILRESEFSFIGHITEEALSEVRADKIFMSARAISLEQGVTNDYMAETLTDRAIIHIGQKVILAADHSKFGSISTSLLAPISDFDIIITDKGIDHGYVQTLEEKGITVILA